MQNILWGSAKILSKPRPDGTSTMFMCISIDICTYKSTCFMVPAKGYCNNPIAFYELLIQFKTGDRQVSSQRDLQQCCTFVIYHPCLVGLIFFSFSYLFFPKKKFLVKLLKVIKIQSPGETHPSKSPTMETEERKLLQYHSIAGVWFRLHLQLENTGPCPLGAEL